MKILHTETTFVCDVCERSYVYTDEMPIPPPTTPVQIKVDHFQGIPVYWAIVLDVCDDCFTEGKEKLKKWSEIAALKIATTSIREAGEDGEAV